MAEKLDKFEFLKRGFAPKYPWDTWLDGSVYRLTRGEDFQCKVSSMRSAARQIAFRRGLHIRTSVSDNSLTIQAYSEPNGKP